MKQLFWPNLSFIIICKQKVTLNDLILLEGYDLFFRLAMQSNGNIPIRSIYIHSVAISIKNEQLAYLQLV